MTSYLTTTEAAARLRVRPQTLRAWRLSGKGPRFSKPSASRVLYAETEIARFLEVRTFAHTAEETTRRGSGRARSAAPPCAMPAATTKCHTVCRGRRVTWPVESLVHRRAPSMCG